MEEKKLSRRERERLLQRQETLTAALELFSQKGYQNVSMHDIAAQAEFSIGTLYKFFKNKKDLYKALIREQSHKFHAALTKAIEEPDQEIEKLRNYVKVKGELFGANAAIIRLYFAETQGARFSVMWGLDAEIRRMHGEFLQTLASIFENGMKKNRFKRIADPRYLAVVLDSISNSLLFLRLEEPERHPYLEEPDTILNILFKGLVEEQLGSGSHHRNARISIDIQEATDAIE